MRNRSIGRNSVVLSAIFATALVGAGGLLAFEATGQEREVSRIKLDDTAIFIEINDTDGDAGIQLFLDGKAWTNMEVTNPDGDSIFGVFTLGSVAMQGITELFFESAEPSFDVQTLDELLDLFPEGDYRFDGVTTEGKRARGKARLTHDIPAAPVLLLPEEGDDEVDPDNTVIDWLAVPNPPGSKIIGYEVNVSDEDNGGTFSADVSRRTTSITVPPEFMQPKTDYKFEVLAKEKSGNQTISEREFRTGR